MFLNSNSFTVKFSVHFKINYELLIEAIAIELLYGNTCRDLGTCLDSVQVLWMAQCGLEDIDGLSAMFSLRELYLAYNDITDISPCSMLEHLHTLDLEG